MNRHQLSTFAGVLAVVVSVGSILTAVLFAPWFSWQTNTLSDLGVADAPERHLFNYGLLLTGLLGLLFLPALRQTLQTLAHKLAVAPIVASLVGVAGVGLFPSGHPLHFPMALSAYLGFIAGVVLYGVGDYLAGSRRRGVATVGSGVAHFGSWVVWAFFLVDTLPGLAVPEFVGALLFDGWVLFTATRLVRDERYSTG